MLKIDLLDRKILYELDKDARIPINTLAKKLRKSKQFVDYRIKKLAEDKILRGYNTFIDMTALGYYPFRIYLRFHSMTMKQREEMTQEMIKFKEIWWYGHAEGMWNVLFVIALKDIHLFYNFWGKVLNKYGYLIKDQHLEVYLDLTWFPSKFLIEDKNNEFYFNIFSRKEVALDDLDRRILRAIVRNARYSYIDLEKQLKTSRETIKKRIKNLERIGVIVGYKVWFDERLLGYHFFKVYLKLKRWDKYAQLYEYCKRNPHITAINKTIGGADFEIELKVKDLQKFEEVIDELQLTFPELIESYEFIIIKTENKFSFLPDNF